MQNELANARLALNSRQSEFLAKTIRVSGESLQDFGGQILVQKFLPEVKA